MYEYKTVDTVLIHVDTSYLLGDNIRIVRVARISLIQGLLNTKNTVI